MAMDITAEQNKTALFQMRAKLAGCSIKDCFVDLPQNIEQDKAHPVEMCAVLENIKITWTRWPRPEIMAAV